MKLQSSKWKYKVPHYQINFANWNYLKSCQWDKKRQTSNWNESTRLFYLKHQSLLVSKRILCNYKEILTKMILIKRYNNINSVTINTNLIDPNINNKRIYQNHYVLKNNNFRHNVNHNRLRNDGFNCKTSTDIVI